MRTLYPWYPRLLARLDNPNARLPQEDSRWQSIESALLKLGTLQQQQVNCAEIGELALQLLENCSKDLHILMALLRTRLHQPTCETCIESLHLLHCWIEHFFELAVPTSLETRTRLLKQALQRIDSACRKLPLPLSGDESRRLQAAATNLQQALPDEVKLDGWYPLSARWGTVPTADEPQPQTLAAPAPPAEPPRQEWIHAEPDDRVWKQGLLQLAARICAQDPGLPLGYRLRRHAIWGRIISAPLYQPGGNTQLAAPDPDLCRDYRSRLAQPDLELWQQIEQSLTLCPFWLDGHRLSALVAQRLEHPGVAEAIAQELRHFMLRIPLLSSLRFSDGSEFVSEESRLWLSAADQTAPPPPQQDITGIPHTLPQWNAALRQSTSTRRRFFLLLQMAHQLEQEQLGCLAELCYAELQRQMTRIRLTEWEPEIGSLLSGRYRHPSS